MVLPKIDLPRYKHKLVGLNKEVTYRPFTLKEQKILLLAKQSEDESQMIEAIKQIIELCSDGKVNPNELAFFDIEDFFLRIRSKSVSDVTELLYKDKETQKKYKIKIKLDDVKVTVPESHTNKIQITNTVGMVMKYPTLETLKSKENLDEDEFIKRCIDYIYDDSGMYYLHECTNEEINDWIESLDTPTLLKVQEFFNTMPRLRYEYVVKLEDGKTETLKFEGLESFFT